MSSNTTYAQKEILLEYMTKYPTMATNCPSDSSLGRQTSNKCWEKLCENLNANGPPIKNVKAWKKTWADYKHRAKSKLAKNKNSLKKTGRGPFKEVQLTPFVDAVAELGKIKAAVLGISDAKSFGGDDERSGSRPTTSRASANEDEVENILRDIINESESNASSEYNVPASAPKNVKTNTPQMHLPEPLNKLELFKSSASSSEEFHKKVIEVLMEIRDLKQQQVDILKKQAADSLTLEKRKLLIREQELKIAIRRNELKEYELGLRNN